MEKGEALGKVAKGGAGIVLAGTVVGMLLNFLTKAVLARYYERSQYGSFTLTVTVLSIAMTIALLGLQNGLSREIARHLQRDREVALKLASTGVLIGSSSSLAIILLLFTLAPNLGNVLNDPYLNQTLRIASPALLPMVLTMIIVAISRDTEGLGRTSITGTYSPPAHFPGFPGYEFSLKSQLQLGVHFLRRRMDNPSASGLLRWHKARAVAEKT